MTRQRLLGLALVVVSMSLAPAFAQDGPKGGGGAGGAGGGNGAGGGVSGVSGGGNSPGAGGGGGGGGSSFGGGGGDMGGGSSMGSSSPDWGTFRGNRSAGGLGSRGGRAAAPSYARSVPPGGGGDTVRSDGGRSRGDRPALGLAVERTVPIDRGRGTGEGFINSRYYDPFGFGYGNGYSSYSSYCGFAYSYCNYGYGYYGLNSLYFDPYWFYGAQSGGMQGPPVNAAQGLGSLRLKIKPNTGEVFVDGYYVGTVGEFDGAFQKLPLEQGHHRVEVRLLGYEPLVFDIDIRRGQATLFEGQLRPRQ